MFPIIVQRIRDIVASCQKKYNKHGRREIRTELVVVSSVCDTATYYNHSVEALSNARHLNGF